MARLPVLSPFLPVVRAASSAQRPAARGRPRCALLAIALAWSLLAASAAQALLAGDLLVTDRTNGRVIGVRPGTGQVWVVSPRPGGADLLDQPAGIVMTDFGIILVVDEATSQLVGVDAATGDQFVVMETGGSAPLAVGTAPFGLALRQTEGAYEMWISARGSSEIRHVMGLEGFGIASETLSPDARWAAARGVAVSGDRLLVAMDDGQGYWRVALDTGEISDPLLEYDPMFPGPPIDHSPDVPAWDVEPYEYDVPVNPFATITFDTILSLEKTKLIPPFFLSCDPAGTRLVAYGMLYEQLDPIDPWSFAEGTVEPADGTPLRCPTALATGLDGLLYVVDTSLPGVIGDPTIVRVAPGSGADPTVVASLASVTSQPMGLAVAPVSAPEPAAGAGAIALGALLALRARRRRA